MDTTGVNMGLRSFGSRNQSFRAQPGTTPPQVFIDRPPETSFASVGIVEVRGPVTAPPQDFVNAAVAKGTELGCDVLVAQAAYEMRPGVGYRRHLNGVGSWLFTCGVHDPAKPAMETARLADALAQEIVRTEFGDPICPIETASGTHLPSTNCWLNGTYRIWNDGQLWLPNAR